MTLNVQNVHRWLIHIPAVACGSLSLQCQWFSQVTQIKLTKVHSKTRELVLASVAAFVKTPALPTNQISRLRLGELGPLIISNEVKAI